MSLMEMESPPTAASAPPAPDGTPATPTPDAGVAAPAALPEGLPADLIKDGALNIEAITQLHAAQAEAARIAAEREASLPKDGVYKIELPPDLVDPEGKPIQLDLEHPAYKTLISAAVKLKLTPAEASEFAADMVRQELALATAEAAAQAEAKAKELALLGAEPVKRIAAAREGLTAQIGEAAAKAILMGVNTAEGVKAVEALLAKLTAVTPAPPPAAEAKPQRRIADIFYPKPNAA